MALTKTNVKVTNISELATRPNSTDGLTDQTFKALFDKSVLDIKTYINDTLTVEADAAIALKANQATTYTKTEIDNSLLSKSGNLSGLASTATSRTNLGLGTMAVETATNYLSKSGNLSGLGDTSTSRTNLGLGTMATATATNYLAKSENLSGLANTSTSRTNLGLGTMAVETATNYLAKSGNLSGLSSTATSRTNLGLGNAATRNVTASTADPSGGNDGDIWIKYS